MALLAAGHDTSAASLSWAFERLARHPRVQERLREGEPEYLDAVVKEVLRVRPALTIAPRKLLEPVTIAGHELPAGVHAAACLWLAMRREDLWPDAAAFRPERWLEEGDPPDPLTWIPFGGGVRRCAGAPFAEMEMREVLRAAVDAARHRARPPGARERAPQRPGGHAEPRRRGARDAAASSRRRVADRLDVVPVRIEHEGAVVARVVDLAHAGPAVVAAAGRQRRLVEGADHLAVPAP